MCDKIINYNSCVRRICSLPTWHTKRQLYYIENLLTVRIHIPLFK